MLYSLVCINPFLQRKQVCLYFPVWEAMWKYLPDQDVKIRPQYSQRNSEAGVSLGVLGLLPRVVGSFTLVPFSTLILIGGIMAAGGLCRPGVSVARDLGFGVVTPSTTEEGGKSGTEDCLRGLN